MSIALRELIRQPGRFLPVGGAVTLLVILLVVLGGFLDGLSRSSTGAYRALDGTVLVLSEGAGLDVMASTVPLDVTDAVSRLDGVAAVGSWQQVPTTAGRVDADPDALRDIVLIGYDLAVGQVPDPPGGDGAVVDAALADVLGLEEGDRIAVGPEGATLTVTAVADDLTQGAPTVWIASSAWRSLAPAIAPFGLPPEGSAEALVVRPSDGTTPEDLGPAIAGVQGVLGATPEAVIGALEVVAQQTATFQGILTVTFAVTLLVIALFFSLITLERTALYAVLKAIGARSSDLLLGLSLQALCITAGALVVGISASLVLVSLLPPDLPVELLPGRLALIALGTLLTGVIGGLTTLRRILAIDPASSIG